ncbi:hypothetical protein ISF_04622 [Cordyceps fumosorosea ARSEF 2679]|uniref:Uncharacterized protein n=1 Tax=Cordyceps fumosorosea (strain ARSEF 2679) TaxID=1081104 RepID=A0A167WKP9_CORFA|nr:hypothetical protein ISF_04622 [Cordyceps fumosorosea ARSEF 2679]OAA63913.1 hypothetical protein ISF_04622 [Cordyceps fumosorosea ARSEF 2679]
MDPASVAPRSDAAESDHPPVIATTHLARFEFSDEGTKILMVEWQPEAEAADIDSTAATPGPNNGSVNPNINKLRDNPAPDTNAGWEVSWPGKSTLLPARDADQDGSKRRVYFLLPEDVPIPPTVTIARRGRSSLILKPLPAIFPPGFDAEPGSRGVLHTLWAKKRLRELEREMDAEMRTNSESVGLQMAYSEKQWIIETFLTPPKPRMILPISPVSPISGRLGEKLKGLRLATSPDDLLPSPTANTFMGSNAPSLTLSPDGNDIAVPSFAPMSLNAAARGDLPVSKRHQTDAEDDLFALPISPRTPDMKRAQFGVF